MMDNIPPAIVCHIYPGYLRRNSTIDCTVEMMIMATRKHRRGFPYIVHTPPGLRRAGTWFPGGG